MRSARSVKVKVNGKVAVFLHAVAHGAKGNGNDAFVIAQKRHTGAHLGGEGRQSAKAPHGFMHTPRKDQVARLARAHGKCADKSALQKRGGVMVGVMRGKPACKRVIGITEQHEAVR